MPPFVWLLIWAAVIATVGFLVIRERRAASGREQDRDRIRYDAERPVHNERSNRGQDFMGGSHGF